MGAYRGPGHTGECIDLEWAVLINLLTFVHINNFYGSIFPARRGLSGAQ